MIDRGGREIGGSETTAHSKVLGSVNGFSAGQDEVYLRASLWSEGDGNEEAFWEKTTHEHFALVGSADASMQGIVSAGSGKRGGLWRGGLSRRFKTPPPNWFGGAGKAWLNAIKIALILLSSQCLPVPPSPPP